MVLSELQPVPAGTILHRIHRRDKDPIFFGPRETEPIFHFDDPEGNYKVFYAAWELVTSFGEVLVRAPSVPTILSAAVEERCRTEVRTLHDIRLYPLIDERVSGIGLSFTDLHSNRYGKCRKASRLIWTKTDADGIIYASRYSNRRCLALFDRARDAIGLHTVVCQPIAPEEAKSLAAEYGKSITRD